MLMNTFIRLNGRQNRDTQYHNIQNKKERDRQIEIKASAYTQINRLKALRSTHTWL